MKRRIRLKRNPPVPICLVNSGQMTILVWCGCPTLRSHFLVFMQTGCKTRFGPTYSHQKLKVWSLDWTGIPPSLLSDTLKGMMCPQIEDEIQIWSGSLNFKERCKTDRQNLVCIEYNPESVPWDEIHYGHASPTPEVLCPWMEYGIQM